VTRNVEYQRHLLVVNAGSKRAAAQAASEMKGIALSDTNRGHLIRTSWQLHQLTTNLPEECLSLSAPHCIATTTLRT